MGPVLADIKKAFENRRKWNRENLGEKPICSLHAFFMQDEWMYSYLFPEILDYQGTSYDLPCHCFEQEQILRIMAEHGLL